MGCLEDKAIKRQEQGEKLHYYIFDVWAYNGQSLMNTSIEERIKYIDKIKGDFPEIDFAQYYSGEQLWDKLHYILEIGGEGVVITKKDSCPEPGKRRARKTLKIKKEIAQTIDCFFTGKAAAPTTQYTGKEIQTWKYWQDLRTGEKLEGTLYDDYFNGRTIEPITKPYFYGWAGSLEIGVIRLKDKKVIPIGWLSGLTDEVKANWKEYKFKPIEVTAMEFTEDRALRHGKLVKFRPDLKFEDCNYEKIWGNE